MLESKYNLYLLLFTFINNFNLGLILLTIYMTLKIISYLDKIDKYYNENDKLDVLTKKMFNFIFNKNYGNYFTFSFLFVYIFFIDKLAYPLFDISTSILTAYNIFMYENMSELRVYTLFIVSIINIFAYEYFLSKIICLILVAYHMNLFLV
jgi:hypothetical protein